MHKGEFRLTDAEMRELVQKKRITIKRRGVHRSWQGQWYEQPILIKAIRWKSWWSWEQEITLVVCQSAEFLPVRGQL